MSDSSVYVPGQPITTQTESRLAGAGTYVLNGEIYSSLVGQLSSSVNGEGQTVIEIVNEKRLRDCTPETDSIVTCEITEVTSRQARCCMTHVGRHPLQYGLKGVIRKEDVYAHSKDRTEVARCFRLGDVVLAKVVALGENHTFILTTAEAELGVVFATGPDALPLVPISWCEMQCLKSLDKQPRKVAKLQEQYLPYPLLRVKPT